MYLSAKGASSARGNQWFGKPVPCLLSAPEIEAVEQLPTQQFSPWLGHFVFGASGLGSYCYFLGISELP